MDYFDLVYLTTIPIYLLSIHFLFSAFSQHIVLPPSMLKIFALYGVSLFSAHIFTGIPIVTFLVNLLFFFIISYFYTDKINERVVHILQILGIILGIETLFGIALGMEEVALFVQNQFSPFWGLVVLRILLCSFSFLIYRRKNRRYDYFSFSTTYYLAICCILLGIVFLYLSTLSNSNLSELFIFLCNFIVLLVVSLVFYLEEKVKKMFHYHVENAILKEQSSALENQQELIKQSLYSTKALRHDMKNQILVLLSFVEKRDYEHIASHSQFMLENIEGTKTLASSGHFVIDSLINYKLSAYEDITRNVSLQVTEDLPLLAYDLTVILGNLIDNAVTAVNLAIDEKIINLLLDCDKGNFVLIVENSFQGKVHYEHGRYHSTKLFSANHGYGLANVEKAVKKNLGSMEIEHGSDRFTVTVVIPI